MRESSGGYKKLPFFKQAEIIYDFIYEFTNLYINPKSRTKDQMEQAARSGKQNIADGYLQKSIEGKLKLLGDSRGSLEELLNDYNDYKRYIENPEQAANCMICLINQTNLLLDQKIR